MTAHNSVVDNLSPVGDEKLGSEELLETGSLPSGKPRPAHYVEIDAAASARLRRKLDLCLLPIITLVNLMSFIDRANIGNARVAGLDKDIGLVGYDFQYAQMIFYIFYFIIEVPSVFAFKSLGSMFLAVLVIGFGITSIGTAFVTNKAGLFATRFLLGSFEGGLLPGLSYLLSRYYTRSELVFRIGVFLALSPSLSGAFGGLMAYGFLQTGDVGSVTADWRKIFLWEGVITTIIGIASLWLLPTWPEKTRMLNEEERQLAIHRVQNEFERSNADDAAEHWLVSFKKAFNPTTCVCIALFACANTTIQGMAVFMPTVLRGLGKYTALEIQLRTIPPYAVAATWAVLQTYYGWKANKKALLVVTGLPIALIGWILFVVSKDKDARYAACFLTFTGYVPLGPVYISWALANNASATSRGVAAALIPGVGTIGSIVGMWSFTSNYAPMFRPGSILNVCFTVLSIVLAVGLWVWQKRENAKKSRGDYDYLMEGKSEKEIKDLGHKSPLFRYVY